MEKLIYSNGERVIRLPFDSNKKLTSKLNKKYPSNIIVPQANKPRIKLVYKNQDEYNRGQRWALKDKKYWTAFSVAAIVSYDGVA